MSVDVIMPRLSDSMEEGTVLRWLKQVGEDVKRGDPLVEIETDKANMTYEATDEGTLVEIVADEGDTLAIGEVIARIGEAGEVVSSNGSAKDESTSASAERPPARLGAADSEAEQAPPPREMQPRSSEPPVSASAPAPVQATPASSSPAIPPLSEKGDGRLKASPVARRVAADKGVELRTLHGTGPGGRIVKADVEAAVRAPQTAEAAASRAPALTEVESAKGRVEVVELTKLQATVTRRMAESKATVPHFQLQSEIDMSEAVKVRDQLKRMAVQDRTVPTYNDMIVKACSLALREFPRANGSYRDGKIELYSRVNVGVAVAAQDALIVPTIFDADRKSLGEIAAEAKQLAARVREGAITPPELSGGTFTVSNLGMYGVTHFDAVINPPQAGLLSVGALQLKPAADQESGAISARHLMGVTLACDHRILYGADGARFLGRVRELLEQPLSLAL